ncbi:MAG TPA: hypothetical protein VHN19_07535 [Burkholderiales bacterium]|nr:hypothetical protein [Burkholderiales bacterium]
MTRDHSLAARGLILWCLGAALAIDAFLRYAPFGFSAVFAQLLATGDWLANWLLLALAVGAYALRGHAGTLLSAVRMAGSHPWRLAAVVFPLLCLGALRIYHDQPLSMDEYAVLFQAKAFAAGRLGGVFPPELVDALIPHPFQNVFLAVSRTTGEVSSRYWPGFALLLAPFAWLNVPWAANPLISALTLPAVHRLTRQVTGSSDAAAWAVMLVLASPVFVIDALSYYSMPASLLLNALFAVLLLQPTAMRAVLAGVAGSIALTLHQPVPHFLFALPFALWLLARADRWRLVLSLAAGYLPLTLLLGLGWQDHLTGMLGAGAVAPGTPAPARPLLETILHRAGTVIVLPGEALALARVAGLTKVWTWAAAGLLVLSACGLASARASTPVKLLAAAALTTFFGYFFFPFDQGHGWGFRYFHSAWFVLPLLAGLCIARAQPAGDVRGMAAWLVALSLLFANGARLAEVETFVRGHLEQVPPLARPAPRGEREVVFVQPGSGFYVDDLVQNDPLLRGTRIVMVSGGEAANAALMTRRFPGFVKRSSGDWGEQWRAPPG